MKILVIGHSYINSFAQEKYLNIMQMDESIKVNIIIPNSFNHMFGKYFYRNDGISRNWIHPLNRMFNGNMTYILSPFKIYKLIIKLDPDLIHIEEDPHSLISIEIHLILAIIKKKYIVSYFIWDNLNRKPKFPLNIIKKFLTSYALKNANGVVCGNKKSQELLILEKKFSRVTTVIPQFGINTTVFNDTNKVINNELTIGYMGRLVDEKGLCTLLKSLTDIQDLTWKLIIVGNGPLKCHIENVKLDFQHGKIELIDACKHDYVSKILKKFDIFVLPSITTSKWAEQFGLTLAQAMSTGIACIGSSSGAIPDLIGDHGLIFSEGNKAELSKCIRILLSDHEKRLDFGNSARQHIKLNYSEEIISRKYINYFKNLLGNYVY